MLPNALRYILAVAQAGSIRVAAGTLNVAQSAISRQILNVEAELGVVLFERHARGVSLTPAGEVFLRYVRDNRALSERVRTELDALSGLRRGMVRIWAIDSVVQEILPLAVSSFVRSNPGIRFEITVASTDEVVAAVQDIRADLGIAFQPHVPADLRVSLRMRYPVHALMSATHPLAASERLSIVDTLEYPIALTPPGSGSRTLIDATVTAAGAVLIPSLESNSVHLLAQFASQTNGITFLSRLCGSIGIRSGNLAAIRLRDRLMSIASITVLVLAERVLPVAAQQFQNHLCRQFRDDSGHQGMTRRK